VPFEVGDDGCEGIGRDSPAVQPVFQLPAAPKANRQKAVGDFDRERALSAPPHLAPGGVVKDDPRLEPQRDNVIWTQPNGDTAVEDDPLMTVSAVRRVNAHDFHNAAPA